MRRLLSVLASSAVLSVGLVTFTAGEARADETARPPPLPPLPRRSRRPRTRMAT